ncbi:MAG: helix-turn-helix transcriptional regulator [Oscillospiraceae bacterium]|nr:helix-turn-helix transcriptional regulator [Oscillospiraceae bacterium]
MLRLRVDEILKERGKTKYWLNKSLGMSYDNLRNMVNNQTKSISYANIEAMCVLFDVTPNELFEWDFEK